MVYSFDAGTPGDYDAVGNLRRVTYRHEEDAASSSMAYDYDNLYRLKQFTHNGSVLRTYSYDPNGNMLTFGNKTFSYGNGNNQLTSDGSRSFSYDLKGRAISVAGTALQYDIFDNMTNYGGDSYTYDAENQRLRKTENGTKKYYLAHGLQVYAEFTTDAAPDAEYVHGLGRKLARYDPSEGYRFFYADHLGSTRRMERDASSANMRVDYFPYGEVLTQAGTDETPYTFTGKELDAATGLQYFGARYYDPRIGRWLVVDPLAGKYPAWSPYVYVGGNPIRRIDPDGESWKDIISAIAKNTKVSVGLGLGVGGYVKVMAFNIQAQASIASVEQEFSLTGPVQVTLSGPTAIATAAVFGTEADVEMSLLGKTILRSDQKEPLKVPPGVVVMFGVKKGKDMKGANNIEKNESVDGTNASGEAGVGLKLGVLNVAVKVDLLAIWKSLFQEKNESTKDNDEFEQ